MVRPRVARGIRRSGVSGLASMYSVSDWSSLCSGPLWISARMRSHYRTGLNGPFGSPVFACAGKTDPPSLLILSQTSAGKGVWGHHVIACPFNALRSVGLGGLAKFARLEGASMRKNAPGDPGQFIGQRNCEDVAVQPLFGRFNPGPEPVALPALRLDQHHPRRLHKQYPQVAVAPL